MQAERGKRRRKWRWGKGADGDGDEDGRVEMDKEGIVGGGEGIEEV